MKTVYIPKGETVHYESLSTEHLVINGCLRVDNDVRAKSITGCGVLCAGSVSADTIRLDELETAYTVCKRLICKRAATPELFASESAAISCFLSASYVETGRLTVASSEIDKVKADEVVNLSAKKRTLLGTLLASTLRSFWTRLTAPVVHGEVMAAEYTPVQEKNASTSPVSEPDTGSQQEVHQMEVETQPEKTSEKPVDMELNRLVGTFRLLREMGYTLRIIPGTPEENAPIFDFEEERIIKRAA